MSNNNQNMWELAENFVEGKLSDEQFAEVSHRIAHDPAFATEFNEITNLIRSMADAGKQKRFKAMLRNVHQSVALPQTHKKRNILFTPQLWRTAGVAACVAIVTSTITFWSLKPSLNKNESRYNTISREVTGLKIEQAKQLQKQMQLEKNLDKSRKNAAPTSDVHKTGTGFALTNNGYFVTAYHVLHDEAGYGDSVYIQTREGQYFKASLVTFDATADIAIMKVEKSGFKFGKGDLPYSFSPSKAGLGTHIFTLGYPTEDIAYSEGYISSRNGYEGNKLQYTLELPVGHGQSGSPLIDAKGNILGLLTAVGSSTEDKTYAVSTTAITALLANLTDKKTIKLPRNARIASMSRPQQIEKMEAYTFSVKVYKK